MPAWLISTLIITGILMVGIVGIVLMNREVERPDRPEGTASGNALDQLFNPGQARANEEIERQKRVQHVTPAPDDRPPASQMETGEDGKWHTIHLRMPKQ
jgi:hypothetical protein